MYFILGFVFIFTFKYTLSICYIEEKNDNKNSINCIDLESYEEFE